MPIIRDHHDNSDIYINVAVFNYASLNLANLAPVSVANESTPEPKMFKALVDTGAQVTMISPKVSSALGLDPLGKILVSGVGPSAHYHNAYLFHVGFVIGMSGNTPKVPGEPIPAIINILQTPIYGGEISSTGGKFDVLLGMDVISTGQLVVSQGMFSFAW